MRRTWRGRGALPFMHALIAGLLLGAAARCAAAGGLVVEQAWIRAAPPGAMMLAGYATLRNSGDAPLTVGAADSEDFGSVSLHETVAEGGVERMRPLAAIELAPGASVQFSPGGRHFMLMQARRELRVGATVKIHISTKDGAGAVAQFVVREDAP